MSKSKETLFSKLRNEALANSYSEYKGKRHNIQIKFLILFITILICTFFFSFHFNKKSHEISEMGSFGGMVWTNKTLVAEFTFPIYKSKEELQKDINEAVSKAIPVFILDESAPLIASNHINTAVEDYLEKSEILNDTIFDLLDPKNTKLTETTKKEVKIRELKKIQRVIQDFFDKIYKTGFVDINTENIKKNEILVRASNNKEFILPTYNLTDSNGIAEKAEKHFLQNLQEGYQQIAFKFLSKALLPNLKYSQELSKQNEEIAANSVPLTESIVKKGDIIVEKGERISSETLQKINSHNRTRFMLNEITYSPWTYIGRFGHVLFLLSILVIYLFYIRKRIFYDNMQMSIICIVLVIASFLSWLSLEIPVNFPIEYIIFLPSLSMLCAIVFDSRTAFYITITMALMIAGIRGNDYDTGTAMLFAGTLAAYTVRDIQSRTQIFQSFLYIFLGFAIPVISFGFERSADIVTIGYRLGVTAINSALAPFITFGLLFILERLTSITTDLKLSEYNNTNHPLLTKMNETAPGSYQHTMAMAVVAERCAIAIGANNLLTRVGAYFHDIGKITKPEYFIENQIDSDNKHNLLTPRKSADSIKQHINDGIKLAKEYDLPQRIIDFIPMHHGTSLIKHFYAKAIEDNPDLEIKESDYRYPGPKPNSKETAIVMICDSAEAISRLASNEKDKFVKALDKSIQDKLLDGQFDESNLTFKELQTIKLTCLRNLTGMSHQRIEYKEIPNSNLKNGN